MSGTRIAPNNHSLRHAQYCHTLGTILPTMSSTDASSRMRVARSTKIRIAWAMSGADAGSVFTTRSGGWYRTLLPARLRRRRAD
eukprot:646215-Rhodomonas_salina.1